MLIFPLFHLFGPVPRLGAQRDGTGERSANDVEQPPTDGTEERSAKHFGAENGKIVLDVEQDFDVEQPKDVEQAQRDGTEER